MPSELQEVKWVLRVSHQKNYSMLYGLRSVYAFPSIVY